MSEQKEYSLGAAEQRFAELIWEREPISSGELVKLARAELRWKKSTTYTVLRRLELKGLLENQDGMVRALVSREDYLSGQSRRFVNETFDGSLPKFLTAFVGREKLTEGEIQQLQRLIDASRG